MILIFITLSKKDMARQIGKKLLEQRLIACYNLTPIESSYWWENEIKVNPEVLLILKTKDENFEKVEAFLKENSGYEVPEIVAVKPEKVNQPYLDWVNKETGGN